MHEHDIKPHVLVNTMEEIVDTDYWNIFDGHFKVGSSTEDERQISRRGGDTSPRSPSDKSLRAGRSPRAGTSPMVTKAYTPEQARAQRLAHPEAAGMSVGEGGFGSAGGGVQLRKLEERFDVLQKQQEQMLDMMQQILAKK